MDIDIVYLWVDGNDAAWREKRDRVLGRKSDYQAQAVAEGRFVQNDELRYSLRSLEIYAPWIRRVHILTDNQCPSWLNTDNPKVHLVSHSEVLPIEVLPTFNSVALEMAVVDIPGLSEHFLFANDDTFFGRPVEPSFFFQEDGRTIVRLKKMHYRPSWRKHRNNVHRTNIYRSWHLVAHKTGLFIPYQPHHNIDAYRKSDIRAALAEWSDLAAESRRCKFRTTTGLHRAVFSHYAIARGEAKMKIVGRFDGEPDLRKRLMRRLTRNYLTDSKCFGIDGSNVVKRINKYNPALFCLNDGEKGTDVDRVLMRAYLDERFPNKSQFEK